MIEVMKFLVGIITAIFNFLFLPKIPPPGNKTTGKRARSFPNRYSREYTPKTRQHNTGSQAKNNEPVDKLKQKGDDYERYIGRKLERKGELVIYNGFIKGWEDQGVDIVSISTANKYINLIQCKNWGSMRMTTDRLEAVFAKLSGYDFSCLDIPAAEVANYHQEPMAAATIASTLAMVKSSKSDFVVRKTLYLSNDYVVELEVGRYLTMMAKNIFKYKDMKIVTHRLMD